MRRVDILFAAAVVLGGCEPPVVNAPPAPPPPPGSSGTGTGVAPPTESAKSLEPSASGSQPLQPKSPRSAATEPLIRLSAGVAVPQLLPDGTQIGVSVDYKINGNLKSSRYVLVLESKAGTIAVPVTLSPTGGTLQGFFPSSVRPEDQPFRVRIDEVPVTGKPVPASNTESLRTSY